MLDTIRPKRKAVFTTFYSFKGGVGRTMALLNTACILAGRGRRVLMIDFDLEAPGLTNLTLENIAADFGESSNGLVELITDFLSDPEHSPLNDEQNRAPFFDTYVRHLEIPARLAQRDTGCLHLLPCGRIDATYTDRLYAIDFKQIYAEGVGRPLFQYLKAFLRDSDRYDYVLIDSRTGFSDEGGICTRDLADHIFVVMGLNRQNVDGTVQFLRRLEKSGWEEGRLVFVASHVPISAEELRDRRWGEEIRSNLLEEELLESQEGGLLERLKGELRRRRIEAEEQEMLRSMRIEAAREAIEQTRFKADFKLRVPYHPRLSLDEEPFLFNWSETYVFPFYIEINRVLRILANDTPSVMTREALDAAEQNNFEDALFIAEDLYAEEPRAAFDLLTSITDFQGRSKEYINSAEPFFKMLLRIDDSAGQQRRYGEYLLLRERNEKDISKS